MTPDQDAVIAKEALLKAFPDETEILGGTVLDQVVNQPPGTTQTVSVPGEHNFDMSATLEFIKVAAELAVAMIELYRLMRKDGHAVSGPELASKVSTTDRSANLEPPERLRLATEVVASLEKR